MKLTGWFIVLCAVVPVPGRALETWAPSILHFPFDGPPLWISAASVADEEKIVNLDLFDSLGLLRPVERQLRALHASGYRFQKGEKPAVSRISVSECASQVLSSCHEGENPYATLADLTTYSLAIVRGTIRTVDLGFGFGMPASLLGVEASEVIKGPAPASLFYVYYP
ncbi:MAG: hypothetical protein JF614_30480, partial [Acidobacteria bacterium]|nr:hypothetical protein [Acidobacteriota bacterium]